MSEPFIAEIKIFAGNFAPRGYAFCDGQMVPINQNQALFSLVGTTYGGDGRTTFALPDLRGRVPLHPGTGPGLSDRRIGEKGGSETVELGQAELPQSKKPGTAIHVGQSGQLTNMPPFLCVNFVIALQGIYPSRS